MLVVFCLLLLLICVLEFILLIKDDGIVSGLLISIKNTIESRNTKTAIDYCLSRIKGMLVDVLPHVRFRKKDNILEIAYSPLGGLGDYIISKCVLEEILAITDCRVDLYCENEEFGNAIYSDVVSTFVPYRQYDSKRHNYDLALSVEHFVHVNNMDDRRVKVIAPALYKKMKYIQDNWSSLYVPISKQHWRERVHFDRCSCLSLNRWSELRMGGVFSITKKIVSIPMHEEFKGWLNNNSEKQYITINYGADSMRKNQNQIKVWPKEYYERLIVLLNKLRPNINVIQLGARESTRITGCDDYLLGESLEQTKWVLHNSLCHIDCEGGLVHLATQLGTRCIVLFGPTPEFMYAYPQNINIRNPECSACMGFHRDWAYKCFKGFDKPICMYGITPEMIITELVRIL